MPLPTSLQLGYLDVEVPDPSVLDAFFAEVIGLQPGVPASPSERCWRNDERAQRVVVSTGPAGDAVAIGFEAVDDPAFDWVASTLEAAGYPVEVASPEALGRRRVRRMVSTRAPWGMDVELVTDMAGAPTPFESPLVPGGFLTEGVGFGHVVVATDRFDESVDFVTRGLGMLRSDWLEMPIGDGASLQVHFFHCNSRHHSLALARLPFAPPQRLHHLMVETRSRDDVGAAFDRAWAAGLPLPNGLGRHDNDGMFSFYVAGPAGFQVEVGHGARVVGDDWHDDRRYDRISAWGHQPLHTA